MATKRKGSAAVTESQEKAVPVIVEAGARTKESIRRLKHGKGSLMREVDEIVEEARSSTTALAGGLLPIVIIYRQKRRHRRNRLRIPLPLDIFR